MNGEFVFYTENVIIIQTNKTQFPHSLQFGFGQLY
jgi:hypothetical protein